MSVCKQGGECRQGSGGGDEGTSGSPEGGAGKKSAQIKKHKGNGSGATEEAAGEEGEQGCRPHANRLGKQSAAFR